MISRLSFCLVVFVVVASFSSIARSEIPSAYLGSWEIDLVRTFRIHFEDLAESYPEVAKGLDLAAAEKSISLAAEQPGTEVLMTITDETITAKQQQSGHYEQAPYQLISESSAQVTVKLFPSVGEPTISTIRLVEGGLAFSEDDESTDDSRKSNGVSIERKATPNKPKWYYLKRRE